jgi:hypothetical protein
MRAKIAQRRRLTPPTQAPDTEEEPAAASTPAPADAPPPANGLGERDTNHPVSPSPEIVQAIVRLGQRVEQLEQTMQGISQRQNTELRALILKARSEALKRAIEVIPPGGPDAAAQIEAVAEKFLEWLCLGAPGAEPDK